VSLAEYAAKMDAANAAEKRKSEKVRTNGQRSNG